MYTYPGWLTAPSLRPGSWRFVLLLLVALLQALPAAAQTDSHLFPETGQTVTGVFWRYWQEHGGLAQQGYPISREVTNRSEIDGNVYTMQYFERAVFELHPENAAPNDVLLSQLGTIAYRAKYGRIGATNQTVSSDNPRLFAETGHTIGGRFRAYWEESGGLAQQGYPISDEFNEVNSLDGKSYRVQYFERAVFEYHPENSAPNDVLLSQLGRFSLTIKLASAAGALLPSPPRIYQDSTSGSPEWPSQPGSLQAVYRSCLSPEPPTDKGTPGTGCSAQIILTTDLTRTATGFAVTFSANWNSGQSNHSWKLHVVGDGPVTFISETGDTLPPSPI